MLTLALHPTPWPRPLPVALPTTPGLGAADLPLVVSASLSPHRRLLSVPSDSVASKGLMALTPWDGCGRGVSFWGTSTFTQDGLAALGAKHCCYKLFPGVPLGPFPSAHLQGKITLY